MALPFLANSAARACAFCVAAPIYDKDGHTIAAVSVSGPAIRMQSMIDDVKQEVRRVAGRISAMLGYASLTQNGAAPAASAGRAPSLRSLPRRSSLPAEP